MTVRVEFAASLRRHDECPPQVMQAGDLRGALEVALQAARALAHDVFDDQRAVRKHVAGFVNQQMVRERTRLNQPLCAGDKVLVAQAMTGG